MKHFFSIIIPVYNVAPYLRECLDSVLAQTFTDWEAICVDDGSTDGSGAILDEYAEKDKRCRVIHQTNAGVSAARNAALDAAQGEWLCFLDADDKVECHWLEDIADGARKHPEVDWIRTSYRNWLDGEEPVPWPEGNVHRYVEDTFTDIPGAVWSQMSAAGFIVLNIYRRSQLAGLKFDTSIWFAEDACFSADYMHKSKLLLTIPNDSYRYRLREGSATHTLKTYEDTAIALGNILKRWETIPGKHGAFTPSIVRHACRCRRTMSRAENRLWLKFLRRAWTKRFFSILKVNGGTHKVRWLLYIVFGWPTFLLEPFGLQWLSPFRWADE